MSLTYSWLSKKDYGAVINYMLTVTQLLKKFTTFLKSQRFTIVLKTAF